MYKRYLKACDGKTCPSKIFLEKMRGGCFQTRFEFVSRLSMAYGIGALPCPKQLVGPWGGCRVRGGLGLAVGSGVVSDGAARSASDSLPPGRTPCSG